MTSDPLDDADGKAVFLSEMTDAEYDEYQHNETHGWKGFTNKLKGAIKKGDEQLPQ